MKTISEYKKILNKLEIENLRLRSLISKENYFKYLSKKISIISQENSSLKQEINLIKQENSILKQEIKKTMKILSKFNHQKHINFGKNTI